MALPTTCCFSMENRKLMFSMWDINPHIGVPSCLLFRNKVTVTGYSLCLVAAKHKQRILMQQLLQAKPFQEKTGKGRRFTGQKSSIKGLVAADGATSLVLYKCPVRSDVVFVSGWDKDNNGRTGSIASRFGYSSDSDWKHQTFEATASKLLGLVDWYNYVVLACLGKHLSKSYQRQHCRSLQSSGAPCRPAQSARETNQFQGLLAMHFVHFDSVQLLHFKPSTYNTSTNKKGA